MNDDYSFSIDDARSTRLTFGNIDVAAFDTLGTLGSALMLAQWRSWNKPLTVLGVFALGHAVHIALGIKTGLVRGGPTTIGDDDEPEPVPRACPFHLSGARSL